LSKAQPGKEKVARSSVEAKTLSNAIEF